MYFPSHSFHYITDYAGRHTTHSFSILNVEAWKFYTIFRKQLIHALLQLARVCCLASKFSIRMRFQPHLPTVAMAGKQGRCTPGYVDLSSYLARLSSGILPLVPIRVWMYDCARAGQIFSICISVNTSMTKHGSDIEPGFDRVLEDLPIINQPLLNTAHENDLGALAMPSLDLR